MTKNILLFAFILSIMFACGPAKEQEAKEDKDVAVLTGNTKKFFDNITSLCGKKFAGEEAFMAEGRESYAGKKMIMHVESCTDEEIRIPFIIGEDKSRTWLLLVEDGRLRLRHDHRHEDGTPEDITLYGGYANERGTEYTQFFPPDEYTYNLLERAPGSEWAFNFSEDMKTFCYCLEHEDNLIFKAKFDLSKPLK